MIAASTPLPAPPDALLTPLIGHLRVGVNLELLTTRKPGVKLMPKHHRGLTQPPAEIDLSPVHETAKVAQADLVALEFDSQVLELVDIALKSFPLDVELVLCLSEFLGVGIVAGTTALSGHTRDPLLQVVNQARLANDIRQQLP